MKSNECILEAGKAIDQSILTEVEKCAVYNELSSKESLRLRLLAEELIGMLPNLSEGYSGSFWVECIDKKFELHASLTVDHNSLDTGDRFLSVSSTGKNAAAKGIGGKIRVAIATMAMYSNESTLGAEGTVFGTAPCMNPYTCYWSLAEYQSSLYKEEDEEKKKESWDELEKSVIGKLADDVKVGVVGKQIDLEITKKF